METSPLPYSVTVQFDAEQPRISSQRFRLALVDMPSHCVLDFEYYFWHPRDANIYEQVARAVKDYKEKLTTAGVI